MTIFTPILWRIAVRSLLQHRLFTTVLASAIAIVTATLVAMIGISQGMQNTLLTAATTMMSGHVNVAGFYKASASQSAPMVTDYKRIEAVVRESVPEVDYIVQRGRGWAKLISDTGSMQVGIGGLDISREDGFRKVVIVKSGDLNGLKRPDGLLLFEEQARKLDVKVGDRLTFSAPTFRGTSNTIDVTVVAIAANMGMLSSWNTFMSDAGLRQLYQLNDETTGALQIYLKDISDADTVKGVQERLRKALAQAKFELLDPDPRAFFMKFEGVNGSTWTGQKLDITNWEDETSFVKWFIQLFSFLSVMVGFLLTVIIGVGIMNVMWITIRERTREIGTLRAVGMQRTAVLSMFVVEGFVLGAFGTVVGVLAGSLISRFVTSSGILLPRGLQFLFLSERLVVTPSLSALVAIVLFITTCITLISLIPSFLAARMKPISAMSHVG
jgi:putative ABC transport system permease protein